MNLFVKNADKLASNRGKYKFILGDEDFYLTENGSKRPEDPISGVYQYFTASFEATQRVGEPVFLCAPAAAKTDIDETVSQNFFIKLSDFDNLKDQPTDGQAAVIAKWFSDQIGGDEIEYKTVTEGWGKNERVLPEKKFFVPWYGISQNSRGPKKGVTHPGNFQASPFLTYEKANAEVKKLQQMAADGEHFMFDANDLRITKNGDFQFTFAQLVEYAAMIGLKLNVRQLFHERRGTAQGKKFGI
jgi:hypothetical protein